MRKITLTIFLVSISILGKGQSGMQFTQYIFNQFYLNPAAAGLSGKTNIQVIGRSQYSAYNADVDPGGSILNSVVSADLPLTKLNGGLGLYFSNNNTTKVQSNQEFHLAYSFYKKLRTNILSFGIAGGLNNNKLNGENYRPRDENDPLIPSITLNSFTPNFNLGVMLFNPNYQIGLSAWNILSSKQTLADNQSITTDSKQYTLSGKLDFGVTYTLDVSPMFIVKSDLNTVSTEIGALATYNQTYWGGLNYRWQDAASVLVGGNFLRNTVKVGYAIDFVTFGAYAKAPLSQEIFLRYGLNAPKFGKKSIIKTPRYSF
jgi:type IX secretion system PorP/SprF family membrane protein